jgi:hypothetical protein
MLMTAGYAYFLKVAHANFQQDMSNEGGAFASILWEIPAAFSVIYLALCARRHFHRARRGQHRHPLTPSTRPTGSFFSQSISRAGRRWAG